MSTESSIHTRTNRQLEFNLGTFNIPTVVGLLTIIGMIWTTSTERAKLDAQTELRLATIEKARVEARTAYESTIRELSNAISIVPNLQYRVTVIEQSIAGINARLDRQSDAIVGVRDDIAEVGTKIEVLSQKLDMYAQPERRTQLNSTPPELTNQATGATR